MLLQAGARQRVAVIVNENARGVRRRVIDDLAELVPPHDLYVSSNLATAGRSRPRWSSARYDAVLLGGGDGTFVQCLSDLAARSAPSRIRRCRRSACCGSAPATRSPMSRRLASDARGARSRSRPRAPRRPARASAAARSRRQAHAVRRLRPRRADPRRLRSLGKVINLRQPARCLGIGAAPRYAMTVGLRSTPRFVLKQLPEIEIVNTGEPVYRVYWRNGRILEDEAIPTGAGACRAGARRSRAARRFPTSGSA